LNRDISGEQRNSVDMYTTHLLENNMKHIISIAEKYDDVAETL